MRAEEAEETEGRRGRGRNMLRSDENVRYSNAAFVMRGETVKAQMENILARRVGGVCEPQALLLIRSICTKESVNLSGTVRRKFTSSSLQFSLPTLARCFKDSGKGRRMA